MGAASNPLLEQRAASNPLLEQRAASLDELRDLAFAGRLYAVVDACDTPSVPEKAREVGESRAVSLYRGSADEMYWAFAPYLFAVDGEVLDWIVAELWTEPWGIFAVADADLEAVRRHFRRFLLVQSPEGEQWYFRFYDPRVLEAFLRHAKHAELRSVLEGLRSICLPRDDARTADLLSLPADRGMKIRIRIPLQAE